MDSQVFFCFERIFLAFRASRYEQFEQTLWCPPNMVALKTELFNQMCVEWFFERICSYVEIDL